MFEEPVRPEYAGLDERALFGGVKGRYAPPFPF
jgi:hypothetical protein